VVENKGNKKARNVEAVITIGDVVDYVALGTVAKSAEFFREIDVSRFAQGTYAMTVDIDGYGGVDDVYHTDVEIKKDYSIEVVYGLFRQEERLSWKDKLVRWFDAILQSIWGLK
jgi:hypothetical protein